MLLVSNCLVQVCRLFRGAQILSCSCTMTTGTLPLWHWCEKMCNIVKVNCISIICIQQVLLPHYNWDWTWREPIRAFQMTSVDCHWCSIGRNFDLFRRRFVAVFWSYLSGCVVPSGQYHEQTKPMQEVLFCGIVAQGGGSCEASPQSSTSWTDQGLFQDWHGQLTAQAKRRTGLDEALWFTP